MSVIAPVSASTTSATLVQVQVIATGLYRIHGYRRGLTRVKDSPYIETIGYNIITDTNQPPLPARSSATLTLSLPLAGSTCRDNAPLITFTYLTRYISRNAPQARPQRDQDHLPPSYRW